VYPPPWLVWFGSTAGSQTRERSGFGPERLPGRPAQMSFARSGEYDVDRSHTEGRATDETATSRAGSRHHP
jgi:hypothetical protein